MKVSQESVCSEKKRRWRGGDGEGDKGWKVEDSKEVGVGNLREHRESHPWEQPTSLGQAAVQSKALTSFEPILVLFSH